MIYYITGGLTLPNLNQSQNPAVIPCMRGHIKIRKQLCWFFYYISTCMMISSYWVYLPGAVLAITLKLIYIPPYLSCPKAFYRKFKPCIKRDKRLWNFGQNRLIMQGVDCSPPRISLKMPFNQVSFLSMTTSKCIVKAKAENILLVQWWVVPRFWAQKLTSIWRRIDAHDINMMSFWYSWECLSAV